MDTSAGLSHSTHDYTNTKKQTTDVRKQQYCSPVKHHTFTQWYIHDGPSVRSQVWIRECQQYDNPNGLSLSNCGTRAQICCHLMHFKSHKKSVAIDKTSVRMFYKLKPEHVDHFCHLKMKFNAVYATLHQ